MKYLGTLLVVKDIEQSKHFYCELLDLKIEQDIGANVVLSGGVFLQTAESWVHFIEKPSADIVFGGNASEIYFEHDDIGAFMKKLETFSEIEYLHPLIEHSWGQQAVRFYDPDHHIIEAAENLKIVVKRFIDSGLTVEQTAKRMDVGTDYIKSLL